jgi:asparagine synthase (glutamine-hydrolysing)
LPSNYKVNKHGRKQLLIEAFKEQLPESVYKRTKKGFEIPLEHWLSDTIDDMLDAPIFSKRYIEQQDLFNYNFINELKKNWKNNQYTDSIYLIWTLLIFQNWWNKYING